MEIRDFQIYSHVKMLKCSLGSDCSKHPVYVLIN